MGAREKREGRRERQIQGGRKRYRYGERNVREREKGKSKRGRGKGGREREIDRYGERECMFRG